MIKDFDKMKEQARNYLLEIKEEEKRCYLLKSKGEVEITPKRAIEWVNADIDDLDCRSKKEMLEILNSWI